MSGIILTSWTAARFFPHEEGLELSTIEKAQEEAFRSLADMARDAVRTQENGHSHLMAIEVRDESGPVFTFEMYRRMQ